MIRSCGQPCRKRNFRREIQSTKTKGRLIMSGKKESNRKILEFFISLKVLAVLCVLGISTSQDTLAQRLPQPANPRSSVNQSGLRGIEKKDIRVAITYWNPSDVSAAQAFAQQIRPVVDAIASGAKLTKADAARFGQPIDELQDWFSRLLERQPGGRPLVFSATPTNARQDVMGGGCRTECRMWGEFCFCLLDFDGPTLSTFPENDPELTTIGILGGSGGGSAGTGGSVGSGGSSGSGGSGGSGGTGGFGGSSSSGGGGRVASQDFGGSNFPKGPVQPVVIVVNGQAVPKKQAGELVSEALKSLGTLPATERLTIKTRSSY